MARLNIIKDTIKKRREAAEKICCRQCDMVMEGEPCYVDKSVCDILKEIPPQILSLCTPDLEEGKV